MLYEESSAECSRRWISGVVVAPARSRLKEEGLTVTKTADPKTDVARGGLYAVRRIAYFFGMITILVFGFNAMITSGLRQIKTSQYGVSNRVMKGEVNAQIVITGSSRAVSHYDPRIIEARTGRSVGYLLPSPHPTKRNNGASRGPRPRGGTGLSRVRGRWMFPVWVAHPIAKSGR